MVSTDFAAAETIFGSAEVWGVESGKMMFNLPALTWNACAGVGSQLVGSTGDVFDGV